MDVKELAIASINPTEKDFERADGLSFHGHTFYGSGAPFVGDAAKMAKLIKDPIKLVKRSKAIVDRWGAPEPPDYCSMSPRRYYNADWDCWSPFKQRLREMGFTWKQIEEISLYKREA